MTKAAAMIYVVDDDPSARRGSGEVAQVGWLSGEAL